MSVQIDGSTGNIIAIKADYSGDVSIGGTLTYEDVTNIDAVGLITARNGIKVDDLGVQVGTGATIDGATNTLTFLTNGSERLRITSDGKMGLGETTPLGNLHVKSGDSGASSVGASADEFVIEGSANAGMTILSGTSSEGLLNFADSGDVNVGSVVYNHSDNSMRFKTADTERLRIDSSGNFGLGVSSPGRNLVVNSGASSGYIQLVNTNSGTSASNGFELKLDSAGAIVDLINRENGAMRFHTNNTQRMQIDTSGRLLLGFTSARANFFNGSDSPKLQLESTTFVDSAISCVRNSSNNAAGGLVLGKTRGTSVGSNTIVQSGDSLGQVSFQGSDGSEMVEAAKIAANIDGTPGANDMPGRLVFMTTADGASSTTERMRIDSSGRLLVATTSSRSQQGIEPHLQVEGTNYEGISLVVNNTGDAECPVILMGKSKGSAKGSSTSVANGSRLGIISFQGADGTDIASAAANIQGEVDGTPGSNDMPGRLVFATTADGNTTPTERARIDSSGRLLVGASSAGAGDAQYSKVQIVGNSLNDEGFFRIGRNENTSSMSTNDVLGRIFFTDSSGDRYGQIDCICDATPGSNDFPSRLLFSTTSNGGSSPTERMRITSSGQISLYSAGSSARTSVINAGTNSGSSAFDIKNNATSTTTGTQVFSIRENGDIYTSGNTTVQSLSSERRLKENIELIDPAVSWTTIKNTPYYSYNFIGQEGPRYGPIVDEVPAEMVKETDLSDDQGPIRTFDNGMLNARLYVALQEAIAKIETLEAKVAALEN